MARTLSVPGMHIHNAQCTGGKLELAAAKSALGHAETGAGAVGLSRAIGALTQRRQQPVLHLRTINHHVAGILDSFHKGPAGKL